MKLAMLLLAAALLGAQILAPNPGFARFAGLPVRAVLGVPGNLLSVKSPFGTADAAAFSDACGLVATNGTIRLVKTDGRLIAEAPYAGGSVLLNVENTPETAVAWLPAEQALLYWRDGALARAEVSGVTSPITSVTLSSPNTARLLGANGDGSVSAFDISLPGGNLMNATVLPGVHAPAFAFGSQIISADEDSLEIETAGIRRTLPGPQGVFTAERMSGSWVHLYFPAHKTHYALHLASEPSLSLLPAPRVTK